MDNAQGKRLYRSNTNRILFGVCGGLGEYFGIDPIIFRIIFVALTLGAGTGAIIYIVLALIVPKAPPGLEAGPIETDFKDIKEDIKERAHGLASELKEMRGNHPHRGYLFGWALLILGLVLLLNQLTPWHIFGFGFFWALLIIFAGLVILRRREGYCYHCGMNHEKVMEDKTEDAAAATQAKETIREIHHHYHRRGGGIFRLFFGLLILIIGFALLVQNFNLIPGYYIDFSLLIRFWPVLIVLAGLSIISRGTWVGAVLSIIITIAIIVLIAALFIWPKETGFLLNSPNSGFYFNNGIYNTRIINTPAS